MEKKYTPQYLEDQYIETLIDKLLEKDEEVEQKTFNKYDLASLRTVRFNETKFIDGVKDSPSASKKMPRAFRNQKSPFIKPREPHKLRSAIRGHVITEMYTYINDRVPGDVIGNMFIKNSLHGALVEVPLRALALNLKKCLLGMRVFDTTRGKLLVAVFAVEPRSLRLL